MSKTEKKKITLQEGLDILKQIPNKPFDEIVAGQDMSDIKKNKGKTGQLIEKVILKLGLSNAHLDFIDGELKTNKCNSNGEPDETVSVCQISSIVDDMISDGFNVGDNYIIQKMNNMIYLRVDKSDENHLKWKCFPPQHVTRAEEKYSEWYQKVQKDLKEICSYIKSVCETGKQLHSTKGPGHYIQIRTKDSKPYHPIHSKKYNVTISDKDFAVYITKDGLKELIKLNKIGSQLNS